MGEIERIERRLKLHHLRVLMSVVEHGSMAKAAGHLATSQPAVSRAIADLEYSLAVRLLDRSPLGIVPTPYGRALIKRSVAAFDELRLGVKDLEYLADPSSGEVRIATPVILAAGFVAAVIDRLSQRYPGIVCHLITATDPDGLYEALEEREIDLLITFSASPITKDHLQADPLYADRLFILAAAKNPLSRRRKVKLADLISEPWTLPPPDSDVGAAFASVFRAAGLDVPAATVISVSGVARVALAAEGRFLTIAPESIFKFAGRHMAIKALPVELPETDRHVGIITLKNRALTPVAQAFVDTAHEVARPLVKRK
jgi:DNA-binding transcriptional LysR family regulator